MKFLFIIVPENRIFSYNIIFKFLYNIIYLLFLCVLKANKWCTRGIDLLEARMDNCACGLDAAEVSLSKLVEFMEGSNEFNAVLVEYSTPETKALVSQVSN